ncbi:transcriptional repressor NrdR [Neorhodopirellula lusitana]|uniref:Transcriptional repressor NrdR n=1 Tax=Neorhodopirellula lusitana TaxID=445327 RepID=A0ABY1QRD9_9BACT|nr:transcriptional repressor NrdR [Neorhodopirellula lusitana]
MRCPFCHSDNDKVLDSRSAQAGYRVRRKRFCQQCGRRFITLEQIDDLSVRVVKSDETREPFDREKIRRGIERACSKRSVPSETIESTVQQIEAAIYSEFDFEIPAEKIGEVVLRFLADVDEVAYIRFASVYREFENAKDFLRIVSGLQSSREGATDSKPTPSSAKSGKNAVKKPGKKKSPNGKSS